MKKVLGLVAASAVVAAVPAWAATPAHPAHPAHPSHPSAHSCSVHKLGYYARGKLVSGTLTPGTKRDHFNGTLSVDVTRANHKAPKGPQTYTLSDARVRFGKGVTSTTLAPGDHVLLHGKITAMPRHCNSSGFTPTITIRNVRISAPTH